MLKKENLCTKKNCHFRYHKKEWVIKDEKTKTYHIIRDKAKGIAYAQTIAEKYKLSYEDILKRVKK